MVRENTGPKIGENLGMTQQSFNVDRKKKKEKVGNV